MQPDFFADSLTWITVVQDTRLGRGPDRAPYVTTVQSDPLADRPPANNIRCSALFVVRV